MRKTEPGNMLLYRWRYTIGYATLILVFIFAIALAGLYAPGGIAQPEINTIAKTAELTREQINPINFFFHALQALSFKLFGVSTLSIKLPAMLLSVGSIVAIYFLLRRWFKSNITILAMLIMATTGQIIFLAQSATINILYVLFSALILLFSSLILQKAQKPLLWRMLLIASVALSMYTPYFFYINVGLLVAALIHPRTRYHLFRRSQRINWLISSAVFVLIISPLVYLSISDPAILRSLAGLDQIASADLPANLQALPKMYFWLSPIMVGNQIAPIFDFTSIFIIILGILALFRQSYAARSYLITAWLILTVPILVINPSLVAIIVVPLFIVLALGVETLLNEWYKLFPKNPYARGVGLVLTVGLIGVMVFSGIDRFSSGYRHMPEAANRFSVDLKLLREHLASHPARVQLIVADTERPLYEAYSKYSDLDVVVTDVDGELSSTNILLSHQAKPDMNTSGLQLVRIITNDRADEADRFYLYKDD